MAGSQLELELSFAEFVEAYMQRIARLPGHDNVVFDEADATIRYECREQMHFVVPQKAYADYLQAHVGVGPVLDRHLAMLTTAQDGRPRSLQEASARLLPMVRDRRYLDIAMMTAQASGQAGAADIAPFPFRPLAGELAVTLVLDAESSTSLVVDGDLETWGVDFDDALEVAMENLRRRTPDLLEPLAPGLYISRWNDAYDASRMLLTELLQRLHLRGEPIVCLPSRNVMLVTGAQDQAALTLLSKTAAEVLAAESRPLSADVLQWTGSGWVEAGDAISQLPALQRARHQLMHDAYAQQAELLGRLHAASGDQSFVASYKIGAKAEGEPFFNYAQLTEGVVTLLPKADHLAFWSQDKSMVAVPWADAIAVFGDALQPLDMHPPRYRVDSFPNAAHMQRLRDKAVIVQPPASPKQALQTAAEKFRQDFQAKFQRELGYDLKGLRLLDAYLQAQHKRGVVPGKASVEGPGAFLGEFFIRQLGGEWVNHEDTFLVRFANGDGVFPFAKVAKQLVNGAEGGDSVIGLYETTVALESAMSGPLNDAQRRLAEYAAAGGGYRIFIASSLVAEKPWAEVRAIDGHQLHLGRTIASAAADISEFLPQVTRYCVFGVDGELVHTEALPPELGSLQPPELLQSILRGLVNPRIPHATQRFPLRVEPQAPDMQMERALSELRTSYASLQRAGNAEALRALKPQWVTDKIPLIEITRQQRTLLSEGRIVWAALVMANNLMFRPGNEDCPGLLVYSLDPHFDARPQELRALAARIFELKQATPEDPALRNLAERIAGESDLSLGWAVPDALTDKDVRGAAFLALRKHIPQGVLGGALFPILVHPGTHAVMMVPCQAWPHAISLAWQAAGGEPCLDVIRQLPEGIRVTHTPDIATATIGDDRQHFVWKFRTTVEAMHADLSIVEFGAFVLENGNRWRFANVGNKPFSGEQFAEWYGCPDNVLRPGARAEDPNNWSRSPQLRSSRSTWYFIGRDANGDLFRGEAEMTERGTLIPLDNEPTTEPAPSGGLSAITRLFSKSINDPRLRYDGVYRVKARPHNDDDPTHCYLRLYPDGTALLQDSTESPSGLAKWFHAQAKGRVPTGKFKVNGDSIRIEIPASTMTLVLSGSIDNKRLVLTSNRFADREVTDEFLFMGWRP